MTQLEFFPSCQLVNGKNVSKNPFFCSMSLPSVASQYSIFSSKYSANRSYATIDTGLCWRVVEHDNSSKECEMISNPKKQIGHEIPRKVPVVYTMGKVGSSTISTSIENAGLACHDIHTLDSTRLSQLAQSAAKDGTFPAPPECVSMAWRERLFIHPSKCFYISLVRDPVARNLSAFFQNLKYYQSSSAHESNPNKAFSNFLRDYHHSIPITWFDREWKKFLNIDVYSKPFPKGKKYFLSKSILLFRIDCPLQTMSKVLTHALGNEIVVNTANSSETKDYSDLYRSVRDVASFTPEYLDALYDTKFARHFWTEEEISILRAKWLS